MRQPWDPEIHLSRRTVLRGAAGFGLAAAGGSLLSACSPDGADRVETLAQGTDQGSVQAGGSSLETTSIRLHAIPPAICIAAEFMAEPFLREQGFTDVQYPPFAAKDVIPRIAAGDIDFGIGYAAAFIPEIAAGAPLVMLGGVHVGCWEIFATGDIKSIRDFKGKTVSIAGPTFTDGIFMAMTLANVGLDLGRDVNVVTYPPTEYARILSSGEVDAVVAFPPVSNDLKNRGIGRVVLNSMTDAPWLNYYCCTAVVHRPWMEKHPQATKAALRAVLQGADVVAQDPHRSAHHMVDHGFTSDKKVARQALKQIPYDIWRDFDPADSVRFYSLRLREAGIIDRTPEQILNGATDFSYLAELRHELKGA